MKKTLSIAGADEDIYADFARRVLAFLIDCLLIGIPCIVLFCLAFPRLLNDRALLWFNTIANIISIISINVSIGILLALYSACFHASRWQATPGKRLMGIIVVNHTGQGLGFVHAFIRQFAFTGCGPASMLIGLALVPFTNHKQGHHDRLCDTFVIHRSVLETPPPRLRPLITSSVLLASLVGMFLAVRMAMWAYDALTDWQDSKRMVLLDEHSMLIDMLLGFFYDYGRCPIHGQDFNRFDFESSQLAAIASASPPKPFGIGVMGTLTNWHISNTHNNENKLNLAEIIDNANYFKEINFNPSGNNQCRFTARLQFPWNEEWNKNTDILYDINTDNGTIYCDPLFSRISSLCNVSTQHINY